MDAKYIRDERRTSEQMNPAGNFPPATPQPEGERGAVDYDSLIAEQDANDYVNDTSASIRNIARAYLALREQVATLTAEAEKAQAGWDASAKIGHETAMRYEAIRAELAALRASVASEGEPVAWMKKRWFVYAEGDMLHGTCDTARAEKWRAKDPTWIHEVSLYTSPASWTPEVTQAICSSIARKLSALRVPDDGDLSVELREYNMAISDAIAVVWDVRLAEESPTAALRTEPVVTEDALRLIAAADVHAELIERGVQPAFNDVRDIACILRALTAALRTERPRE